MPKGKAMKDLLNRQAVWTLGEILEIVALAGLSGALWATMAFVH